MKNTDENTNTALSINNDKDFEATNLENMEVGNCVLFGS